MFEFRLPDLGEGIHEGELIQWHVAVGDHINEDAPLCDMETDKAAVTIPAPCTGVIAALNAEPGETIEVGRVLVVIDQESDAGADRAVIAAPATRRLAREMGIDIRRVRGSGPGGRVTPEDLKVREKGPEKKTGKTRPGVSGQPESFGPEDGIQSVSIPFLEIPAQAEPGGPVARIPLRSLRKKTAVRTTSASILIPHVAHMDEIDVTQMEALRKAYNTREPAAGKLTLLAFVVKAATAALKDYPMFNASLDLGTLEILHKKFYNIGFAADTPRGLTVPVIHDADRLSLAGTGARIRHLAQKARKGEISVEELTRGTFTITNVGAIGGTHVFPIINGTETAILGLGRVEKKPVVREDKVVVRKILPVTLCFDHRVADGAQAAAFVREIKAILEDRLAFMTRV